MATTPSRTNRLLHLPLEAYKSRYTEQLAGWELKAFSQHFKVETVLPDTPLALNVMTGEVLDAMHRPAAALSQIQSLLRNHYPDMGKIWCSDFYHPGISALPYSRSNFKAYSFCWAQTFDQYDFTRRLFYDWMRPWEIAAFNIYSKVFVADQLLADLITTSIPGSDNKVVVVGLPFDTRSVMLDCPVAMTSAEDRAIDVIYTSRMDLEKQPEMFLDLVEQCPDLTFAVCTGRAVLTGTDDRSVARAKTYQESGRLHVYENCTKADYYTHLSRSKVQFNCALQDWVSFTLLEALTFGCKPAYPMFRSFPAALLHQSDYLYTPNDAVSAEATIRTLISEPPIDYDDFRRAVLDYHDETLSRIAQTILND